MTMDCPEIAPFIDAYIDGEFAPEDRLEIERHLEACAKCRTEARRQSQWKAALRARLDRVPAPYRLGLRIQRALDAEQEPSSLLRRVSWRVTPAVLAAGALCALIFRVQQPASPVLEQSLLDHERNLPVEVAGPDPDGVASWFRGKVDFPVRPPRLGENARLLGGRIGYVGNRHAAYLVYFVPGRMTVGHKVSVYVFDPDDVPIEAPRRVIVHDRPIYMSGDHGYRVAVFRDRGVGYAVASDLDEPEMIHLVSTSFGP